MNLPLFYVSYSEGIRFFLCETLATGFAKEKAFGPYGDLKKHVKLYKINSYETIPNFFSNQDDYVIKIFN